MADPAALAAVFHASFSADPNVRISAELELRKLELLEGMTGVVLQLVASDAVDKAIRQSAAIYLKNRIRRSWDESATRNGADLPSQQTRLTPLSPADRQALKHNFLHVLVAAPPLIQSQLRAALTVMIRHDFPNDWPGLAESVANAVAQPYNAQTEGALIVLAAILMNSRFSPRDKREIPDAIIAQTFPHLVQLCSAQLAATPLDQAPESIGRLLHLTFKCYRYTIHRELSPHQITDASIVPWGTLFLQVVNRSIPESAQPADPEERERTSWWKAKKWAYFILNALYSQFGSPSQLSKGNVADYKAFAERFEGNFAPEIFKAYLRQVELLINGQVWLSRRCTRSIIDFLSECVKPKAMWRLLKPHLDTLIDRFLFPIFSLSDEEIEDFSDDPKEFVRRQQADVVIEFFTTPITAAVILLSDLVRHRKQSMLPILTFVNNVVSGYPGQRSAKEKDAALRMISSIAEPIVKSKEYGKHMEGFITRFVVPEFASPIGFLRARACDVVDKFEEHDMDWNDTSALDGMLQGCLHLLTDAELPVRVAATLALPELSRYDQVRTILAPNIGRVMQDVLAAANEVELDRMSSATRSLFAIFSTELMPFAVQLSAQLGETYLRIAREAVELRSRTDPNEYDEADGPAEDKALAALGIFKSIQGLLDAVEELPDHLRQIEAQVVPLLVFTLENELVELYDEVFEVVDTLTFYQKVVHENLWPVFELTHKVFNSSGIDYIEEMLPSLDNFISYGAQHIAQTPAYLQMLMEIFDTTMTSTHLGAEERCCGCKLAESMLLNMRGAVDPLVPSILTRMLSILFRKNTSVEPIITARLYLHALEVVLDAIYYNPVLTFTHLDHLAASQGGGGDAIGSLLDKWFAKLDKLERVHDRKLGIMAVVAVLENVASLPMLAGRVPQLINAALVLFAGLPEAIKERVDAEKSALESDDEEELDELDDGEEDLVIADEDGDVHDTDEIDEEAIHALLQNKMFRSAGGDGIEESYEGGGDDDDDDGEGSDVSEAWSEEVLFTSPLDDVDTYSRFASVLSGLQASYPQLASQFSAEQGRQLQNVINTAHAGGEEVVKKAAASAKEQSQSNGHHA